MGECMWGARGAQRGAFGGGSAAGAAKDCRKVGRTEHPPGGVCCCAGGPHIRALRSGHTVHFCGRVGRGGNKHATWSSVGSHASSAAARACTLQQPVPTRPRKQLLPAPAALPTWAGGVSAEGAGVALGVAGVAGAAARGAQHAGGLAGAVLVLVGLQAAAGGGSRERHGSRGELRLKHKGACTSPLLHHPWACEEEHEEVEEESLPPAGGGRGAPGSGCRIPTRQAAPGWCRWPHQA